MLLYRKLEIGGNSAIYWKLISANKSIENTKESEKYVNNTFQVKEK